MRASWMRPGWQLLPTGLTVSLSALDHCPVLTFTGKQEDISSGVRESTEAMSQHRSISSRPMPDPRGSPLNSCGLFCVFLQGKTPCCLSQGHRYFMCWRRGYPGRTLTSLQTPKALTYKTRGRPPATRCCCWSRQHLLGRGRPWRLIKFRYSHHHLHACVPL